MIHRYYRINALVLIGGATDDWHEAGNRLHAAESIWWSIRRLSPDDSTTEGTDEILAELRVSLDKLAEVQREDPPEDETQHVGDAAPAAAEALDEDMTEMKVAREEEDGLTELQREEAQETDRRWEEMLRHVNPATPVWQWTGATTPPFERAPSFETMETRRLPDQSEEEYLRTVDPRVPAREWELDDVAAIKQTRDSTDHRVSHSAMGTAQVR